MVPSFFYGFFLIQCHVPPSRLLGKVPVMPGEGPGNIWGRSTFMPRTFPIEITPQCPLIPIPRGRSPTLNSTFPKCSYHLPHLPIGPVPFTPPGHPICPQDLPPIHSPGIIPGGTQYPARREMTGALRLLGITVGAIRNQSEGANWLLGVHQYLCKLLLFNTLQNSRWTVATKNGGVSMMYFISCCNSKCYENTDGQPGGHRSRRGKGRRTA